MGYLSVTCHRDLLCVFGAWVPGDAQEHVALSEPVEAIHWLREREPRLRSLVISAPALELLRDPAEPARAAWRWLTERVEVPAADTSAMWVSALTRAPGRQTYAAPPELAEPRLPASELVLWRFVEIDPPGLVVVGRDRERFRVGRALDCDLRSDSAMVSKYQLAFVHTAAGWCVRDDRSSGGTWMTRSAAMATSRRCPAASCEEARSCCSSSPCSRYQSRSGSCG